MELRKDFPIFERKIHGKSLVYLDNAATTQKPKAVIGKIKRFYEQTNANVHRGVYTLGQEATEAYDKAHEVVAKFINASPQEIIFTSGTTASMNLLSYTLGPLLKGKNIVLTEMEHHSNLVPWQQLAKRNGMKLVFIKMKDDFTLDYEDAKITEDTALISVSHVSNTLGTINDVKKLVELGKQNGAITIVDAAQSAAHIPIDVKDIGCDFLAFSGHKMLGPTGIGVLYGRKELLEKMQPFHFGGDMIRKVEFEDSEWNELPTKFEAGTPNISGAVGLAAAINYIENVGLQNIAEWEKKLTKYALEKLRTVEGIKIYHPDGGAGIISFNLEGIHPHDTASLLDDEGIAIRGGHHCTMPLMQVLGVEGTSRASFCIYNTFEDVDRLVEGLKKTQRVFNV